MLRFLIAALVMTMLATAAHAQKIGLGAWENPSMTMLRLIENGPRLGWYYNWRTDQIAHRGNQRRTVEFVPTIRAARNVGEPIVSSTPVAALLGFNEPDNREPAGSEMSVAEAVALWPRLEAYGLRLGSPATQQHNTLGRGSWQRRFMNEVERRGLRVDFMAVHYYSRDGDVAAFRRWLEAVYAEYRRPVWVTEFAMIDWSRPSAASHEANAVFARDAIEMMEELPFVERHAWFAANPYPWGGATPRINLVDNSLRLTAVGRVFDAVSRRVADRRVADSGG